MHGAGGRHRQHLPDRRRLRSRGGPPAGRRARRPGRVRVVDYGIRGMHLAYDLLDGYDALVLVDAVPRRGARRRAPSCEVGPDDLRRRRARPARHGPGRGARQPRAAGRHAPPDLRRRLPAGHLEEGIGLSEPVAAAVPVAVRRRRRLVDDLLRDAAGGLTCASASPDGSSASLDGLRRPGRARRRGGRSAAGQRRHARGAAGDRRVGADPHGLRRRGDRRGAGPHRAVGPAADGQRPTDPGPPPLRRLRAGAGRRLPAVRLRHRRRARPRRLGRQHRRRRGRRGRGRARTTWTGSVAGWSSDAPPLAEVEGVHESELPAARRHRLPHRGHAPGGAGRTLASPDVATCDDCLRRAAPTRPTAGTATRSSTAPTAGRGSRSSPPCPTTAPTTTMAGFAMCAACRAEYDDPADRRFHAQPIACPDCGPTARAASARATARRRRRRRYAAAASCWRPGGSSRSRGSAATTWPATRATSRRSRELRRRKQRGDKPFAVMVARPRRRRGRWCDIDDDERRAARRAARGRSCWRARRRRRAPAARPPSVAPGNPDLGVMLPYTPLHHLLLGLPGDAAGPRLLVMTQRQPRRRADRHRRRRRAATGWRGIADAWLRHDRPIHVPCDDSVVRVVGGAELPVRRSRGYAPLPVALPVRGAAGAGRRRRPEEHVLPRRRAATPGCQPAHRRHGRPRHPARVRRARRAHLEALTGVAPRARWSPTRTRLPLGARGRWTRRGPAGPHRAAPPRARRLGDGRARARPAPRGDRRRLRRHRLRHRRRGLGRRGAGRGLQRRSAGSRTWRYVPLPGGDASVLRPYRMALAHLRAAGVDVGRRPAAGGRLPGRRAPACWRTSSTPAWAACRPPAWGGCSTRWPRWSACATGSTTRPRPRSSWRRWPAPRTAGARARTRFGARRRAVRRPRIGPRAGRARRWSPTARGRRRRRDRGPVPRRAWPRWSSDWPALARDRAPGSTRWRSAAACSRTRCCSGRRARRWSERGFTVLRPAAGAAQRRRHRARGRSWSARSRPTPRTATTEGEAMCLAVPGRVVRSSRTRRAPDGRGRLRRRAQGGVPAVRPRRRRSASTSSCTSASRSSASTRQSARETLANFDRLGILEEEFGDGFELAAPAGQRRQTRSEAVKYLDEFSDPDLASKLLDQIHAVTTQPWAMMEVCGGQTHSIIRHGIDQLLPDGDRDDPRPGLPGLRDAAGDHRPGARDRRAARTSSSARSATCSGCRAARQDLFRIKSAGGDVRVVYSPLDALKLAGENPDREVVFFGIGFETTAPANAMAVYQAKRLGITNFSLLVSHVLVPPAIAAIMESPTCRVQALPRRRPRLQRDGDRGVPAARREVPRADRGHRLRAARHPRGHPAHRASSSRRAATSSRTPTRARFRAEGNPAGAGDARRRLRGHRPDVARHRDDPAERLAALASATRDFDAEQRFAVDRHPHRGVVAVPLRRGAAGLIKPHECAAFGKECTPRNPLGRDDGVLRGRLRRVLPLPPARAREPVTRPDARATSTSRAGCVPRRCVTPRPS